MIPIEPASLVAFFNEAKASLLVCYGWNPIVEYVRLGAVFSPRNFSFTNHFGQMLSVLPKDNAVNASLFTSRALENL